MLGQHYFEREAVSDQEGQAEEHMPKPIEQKESYKWLRGVLEFCVLAAVSDLPRHGYAIAQALADKGFGVIKGGTLYPLLARLEADGLVASTWQAGDGGPGRKVFAITGDGRLELARRVQS